MKLHVPGSPVLAISILMGAVVSASAQSEPQAVRREDGSWLVDGGLPWSDFKEMFALNDPKNEDGGDFQTLAGFILMFLRHIPTAGEYFEWNGFRLEVVDMDGRRIDKVLIVPPGKVDLKST